MGRLRSVGFDPGRLRRAWTFVLSMIGIRRRSLCPRCHGIGSVWISSPYQGECDRRIICRVCDGLGSTMEGKGN